MGFRFRRRVRVLPGVHLNVTGRGLRSVSVGRRGATVNVSGRGARLTVGLPGTGLAYTTATVRPTWRQRRAASHATPGVVAKAGVAGTARAFARGFARGLAGGGLVAVAVVATWWLGAWGLGAAFLVALGAGVAVRRGTE